MSIQKIAVIGSCNAPVIANCLRVMRPLDQVIVLAVDTLAAHPAVEQECDIVFAVANAAEFNLSARLAACRNVLYWPNIVFFGFHPDITYFGIEGRPVRSAMGDYNSFIVASAYADGLSVASAVRLFNKLIYARLGFFEKYDVSRAGLLAAAERIGCDLHKSLNAWERFGIFMYSINHPKLCVLADIAKYLLGAAGLPFDAAVSPVDHVPDHLALGGIWPVYPELARELGVRGSTLFTPPCHSQYDVPFFTVTDFVERTFAIYANSGFSRQDMASVAGIRYTLEKLAA